VGLAGGNRDGGAGIDVDADERGDVNGGHGGNAGETTEDDLARALVGDHWQRVWGGFSGKE
jgi:hypothetical protein